MPKNVTDLGLIKYISELSKQLNEHWQKFEANFLIFGFQKGVKVISCLKKVLHIYEILI